MFELIFVINNFYVFYVLFFQWLCPSTTAPVKNAITMVFVCRIQQLIFCTDVFALMVTLDIIVQFKTLVIKICVASTLPALGIMIRTHVTVEMVIQAYTVKTR